MTQAVLEMHQATLRYGEATILSDLNFALCQGEILGIAGSNGAGKSSLLRLACQEQSPSEGEILLSGQPIAAIRPRERARRIAILPQSMGLQFDLTVRQVISLGRSPHGDVYSGAQNIVDYLLEECDLWDLAQRSYQSLSGGEKQRTQFARVLAQLLHRHPSDDLTGQVLALDEPTAALDLRHQEQLLQLLVTLKERGCAVLLVMHDINLLSRCADRLLFLKQGRVQSLAPTFEQLNETALSELFDFPIKTLPGRDRDLPFIYPDPAAQGV